ncbi:MAG: DUF2207 domain-containing protein [Bacteroidales bacterium]|nr:DUF2207 domain-containing protein [Bacteroidales bacterium]
MKRFLAVLAAITVFVGAAARQYVNNLDIKVVVQRDGSATVTQVWDVELNEGTEWYIPVENLGPMTVSGLEVSENGTSFSSVGNSWNVSWSRSRKAWNCGMVPKRDGAELCWGIGEYGRHVWTVRFLLTGLVQGYDDADAFNFMFVPPGMGAGIGHVRLTVVPGFDCEPWTYDNTRVWAFGFHGDINVREGAVVAESSESFGYSSRLIALVKYSKGMFAPSVVKGGAVQDLIDKALDGSSYGEDGAGAWFFILFGLCFIGFFIIMIWIAIAAALGYKWKKALFGKTKIEGWYRDIPLEGDIFAAEYLLAKGGRFSSVAPAQNIIGAMFLRWIMDGSVKVQADPSSSKRVNLSFVAPGVSADAVEEDLYQYAKTASGANLLLEKNEFENWSKKNYQKITSWPDRAVTRGMEWFRQKGYFVRDGVCTDEGAVQASHLIEFRNFLKDFTISNQREAGEVKMWKEYLVYAQLFGIADKVAAQFKKLYPAEFSELARSAGIDDATLWHTIYWSNTLSSRSWNTAVAKAGNVNGTGGHSSFGGGGGFSGGGFGGGAR